MTEFLTGTQGTFEGASKLPNIIDLMIYDLLGIPLIILLNQDLYTHPFGQGNRIQKFNPTFSINSI